MSRRHYKRGSRVGRQSSSRIWFQVRRPGRQSSCEIRFQCRAASLPAKPGSRLGPSIGQSSSKIRFQAGAASAPAKSGSRLQSPVLRQTQVQVRATSPPSKSGFRIRGIAVSLSSKKHGTDPSGEDIPMLVCLGRKGAEKATSAQIRRIITRLVADLDVLSTTTRLLTTEVHMICRYSIYSKWPLQGLALRQ